MTYNTGHFIVTIAHDIEWHYLNTPVVSLLRITYSLPVLGVARYREGRTA